MSVFNLDVFTVLFHSFLKLGISQADMEVKWKIKNPGRKAQIFFCDGRKQMLKREPRKCWRHLIRSLQIVRDTVFLSRHDYLVIETPRWDANDSFTDKQTSTHTRLVLIAIRFWSWIRTKICHGRSGCGQLSAVIINGSPWHAWKHVVICHHVWSLTHFFHRLVK